MDIVKQVLTLIFIWQLAFRSSNSAMAVLIKIIKHIILLLGQVFGHDSLISLSSHIPLTLASAKAILNIQPKCFEEYVVCCKCDSVYEYNACVETVGSRKISKQCNHLGLKVRNKQTACGTLLLRVVHTKNGESLKPFKSYPYQSLKIAIERLLNRKGFIAKCELWRNRAAKMPEGIKGDITDGNVWHLFSSDEMNNFLLYQYSYLLTLNIDWFQAFQRGIYSVGVIYLTVNNLPREERYKPENVIIAGIIPGPNEPKLSINSFLFPLVEELKHFWVGVSIPLHTNTGTSSVLVRLALCCVTCDIPASRKVLGFLGHNAALGCSKCYKKFVINVGGNSDFSGYDRELWEPRTNLQHRQHCLALLNEENKAQLKAAETKFGLRYSILVSLPYFDPVRFHTIDPMHNLFLGTTKHVMKVWMQTNLITIPILQKFENMITNLEFPLAQVEFHLA